MLVITELAVFLLEDITAHKQLYMVINSNKSSLNDTKFMLKFITSSIMVINYVSNCIKFGINCNNPRNSA